MCYKRNSKYTYLSMCSCCNAVSKYSSVVKDHLINQHKKLPETLVIPIRIENKFERKIIRNLDKYKVKQNLMKKKKSVVEVKNSNTKVEKRILQSNRRVNEKESSIYANNMVKCKLCNDMFSDCMRYIYHIIYNHSNCDIRVSFKCVYCQYCSQYYKNMQYHLQKKHKCIKEFGSLLDCIDVDIRSDRCVSTSKRQCPYCELEFDEVKDFCNHVRKAHESNSETIFISNECVDAIENHSDQKDDFLIMFRCHSCPNFYHTLSDFREHITLRHAQNIAYSKPKRKRKAPKWMENDLVDIPVKKSKNGSSRKNVPFAKLELDVTGISERKCEYCSYVTTKNNSFVEHISTNHPEQSMNLRKIGDSSVTCQEQINVQNSFSENNHHLVGAKETRYRDVNCAKTEKLDSKTCIGDMEHDFDDSDNENFGDSDDDYQPDNSGSDSDKSVKDCKPYKYCMYCKISLTSKQSLHKHIKLKHTAEAHILAEKKSLKIDIKNGSVKRSAKEQNEETLDEDKYIARYKCPFCDFYLHHYEYMRNHVVQSHPEVTNFKVNTKEMIKASLIEEDMLESFKCPNPECDVVSKRKHSMMEHLNTCGKGKFRKHKLKCTLPKAWMKKMEKSIDLMCPNCQLVVRGKVHFLNHIQQHYPGKLFEVELNNSLSSEQIKKNNLSELECTMCPYCDVVTTKKTQLSRHMKRFHSNEQVTNVISCILVNKSSAKDKVKLMVKDIEDMTLAKDESENSEAPRNVTGKLNSEENFDKITKFSKKIYKNTDTAFIEDSVSEMNKALAGHISYGSMLPLKQKGVTEIPEGKAICEIVFIQSTIPCGVYMCPLCDFKTGFKKAIKLHMCEHNSKCKEDIDCIYTIPDTWIKVNKGINKPLRCQFCDFENVNLTLVFRHVLSTHKDIMISADSIDPHISEPLFEIVNEQIEGMTEKYEKEKYRCTSCVPGHIFKSRKGLQLHLKTRHTDSDSISVYETMYKMLDLIASSCNTRQVYICFLCKKKLLNISDLEDHFKQNHPDKLTEMRNKLKRSADGSDDLLTVSPTCEVCCMQFMDEKSLKHHLILHMNKYKPTCTLCDICFTNHAELECHNMEVHSKEGEMCYICGAMFSSTAKLNRHVKWHESGKTSSLKALCQYCGTTLISKNIKKHLVDKHIDLISCECEICTTNVVPEKKKYVQCDQCQAVFCKWYVLRAHKYKEHDQMKRNPYMCKYCNATFQKKCEQSLHSHKCGKLVPVMQTNPDVNDSDNATADDGNITEATVLEEANIDFNLGLAYIKQEYIIVDKKSEQPYNCKLCGKAFTKIRYICNHLKRMHTRDETKRYRCKICKMGFVGKKDFGVHCRSHIGLRQYQCKICQKMYKTAAHLKEHAEIHSLNTYSCDYCGLEFKQRGALLAHVVHHDKLKPLKCLYCNKGYTTHGDLQRHMNSYSKASKVSGTKHLTFCNYCSKDFPNHKALVNHFQIHLPVNPFQCSVCQNNFASFRQMYNHKSRKGHFTDTEKEDGKQDLEAPGNRFRRYQVSKSKMELLKTNKGNTYMEDPVSDNAVGIITYDQNTIEIEIDSSVTESDDRTKTVVGMFESDVIKSMLDADPEILRTVEFHDTYSGTGKDEQSVVYSDKNSSQEGYQFVIQEENHYTNDVAMQDVYVAVRQDAYTDTNYMTENKSNVDNSEKFASIAAKGFQQQETVTGKTQTFQASDGSIVHVCVIKPDK